MCGRFSLFAPASTIADVFSLEILPELLPRYNIAPSQQVLAFRSEGDGRTAGRYRWGLVPFWADDPKIGYKMINARSETAASKPAFRTAFKRRRLIIPADGFFEWRKVGKKKFPVHFRPTDSPLFAFAGLWERWVDLDGTELRSCTVLTTAANPLVATVHNRMPVILPPEHWDTWLNPATEPRDLKALMVPLDPERMTAVGVNPRVNNVRNDDPECVQPFEPSEPA